MLGRILVSLSLAAAAAANVSGCDDGAGDKGAALVGTWVRTKNMEIGNSTRSDVWTLTFHDDGTYNLLHERSESLETVPLEGVESRQGTYKVTADGEIEMTGDWLDLGSGVSSLQDLDGMLYSYTHTAQFAVDEDRGYLFLGPDFNYSSSYSAWGDSYDILHDDGSASYQRTGHVVLLDTGGEVLEERAETYTFTIVDDKNCEGSYSYLATQGGNTVEDSGAFSECTYAYDPGEVVESVGGGTETVEAVRFDYATAGGTGLTEYYIKVGDYYIGYRVGYQSTALVDTVFLEADY